MLESDAPVTSRVIQNDVGGPEELAKAYDETIKSFEEGDIVAGKVVQVDKDEVLLDIGYKSEGVIPARELTIKHDIDPRQVVNIGDEIEALVTQKEDKEGRLILSKKKAQYERAWGQIEKVMNDDGVVDGTVIEVVKGGLIVDIGLRGFLPASLVDLRRVRDLLAERTRVLEAAQYIPLGQLGTTDDCGFAPLCDDTSTSRETAFAKIRARVEGTALASQAIGA